MKKIFMQLTTIWLLVFAFAYHEFSEARYVRRYYPHSDRGRRAGLGFLGGALGGAAIGGIAGGGKGAAIGSLAGGVLGATVGASSGNRDYYEEPVYVYEDEGVVYRQNRDKEQEYMVHDQRYQQEKPYSQRNDIQSEEQGQSLYEPIEEKESTYLEEGRD